MICKFYETCPNKPMDEIFVRSICDKPVNYRRCDWYRQYDEADRMMRDKLAAADANHGPGPTRRRLRSECK